MAPPGRPKAPAPPPPPAAKAAAVACLAPEPRKPLIVPEREMKPLRWKRLQLGQHLKEGMTIWDLVTELPVDRLMSDQLLSLFSKAAPLQRASSCESLRPSVRSGDSGEPQELRIIEGTIQRCGREGALAKLAPPERVASAVREFNAGAFLEGAPDGSELCELLRLVHDNACPTPVQQQKLEEARACNPDQPLGNIERYMWELSRIPAYNERLECWRYLSTWEEDFRPVRVNIEQFETIVECFHSPALPQLLGVVLSVGNYLNGGTKDGRADGFQLNLLKSGGIDAVRDNSSTGNLRRFIISTWLEKCRREAGSLLLDLRPALKNVKRSLETCSGGSLRLHKQVKVSLERTCDEALSRIQAEFAEKHQMFEVVKQVTEDGSCVGARMQEDFDMVQQCVSDLQRLRDRAAERYKQLLGWMHHPTYETSDAFLLLWDDFLIPNECFEQQGPSKVKSVLKPIFCDDSVEIDVYGLGRLWEANIGGLTVRTRSNSATPRGRGSPAPSEGARSPLGRQSTPPWQELRRASSRSREPADSVSSPTSSGAPEASCLSSRADNGAGLPPRPRRNRSSSGFLSEQLALSRSKTSPELGGAIRQASRALVDTPREAACKAPSEERFESTSGPTPRVPSLKDRLQQLTESLSAPPQPSCSPGSGRRRSRERAPLATSAAEEGRRKSVLQFLKEHVATPSTTSSSFLDTSEERCSTTTSQSSRCSAAPEAPQCGPPARAVRIGKTKAKPAAAAPCAEQPVTDKAQAAEADTATLPTTLLLPVCKAQAPAAPSTRGLPGLVADVELAEDTKKPRVAEAQLSSPPPRRMVRARAVRGG